MSGEHDHCSVCGDDLCTRHHERNAMTDAPRVTDIIAGVVYPCPGCGSDMRQLSKVAVLPDGRIDMASVIELEDKDRRCLACQRKQEAKERRDAKLRAAFTNPPTGPKPPGGPRGRKRGRRA